MTALPEYKTRKLLQNEEVPLVEGIFVAAGSNIPKAFPEPPVYLKAQIPGATNRMAHGLVRRTDTREEMENGIKELLSPGPRGRSEGVLICSAVNIVKEYYAACMLDFGSADTVPGGVLIFSADGGSGVEERTDSLDKIYFSLLNLPSADDIAARIGDVEKRETLAVFLERFIKTFVRYKLMVLETNPLCVLDDGNLVVVDCRAEFEDHAVDQKKKDLFAPEAADETDLTRLEQLVEKINQDDPAGTGFVREEREKPPENAFRVATNLCGGGGKMLWEMTTGARKDIFSMNESDTSGGLSGFKSYRILRAILEEMEDSQVLILTGSGMAFQDQRTLASAVWKALRESPRPLPAMLRFGGTNEDRARELFEKVGSTLPVKVKTYLPHVFPNAMVDDIGEIALKERIIVTPDPQPTGEPTFSINMPPGEFFFYPERWEKDDPPPWIGGCSVGFLSWDAKKRTIEPVKGVRCTGCLECETISLTESNQELRIRLRLPEVNS